MAIEFELEVLKSVVNKLDTSLDKISDVSNNIGKLLAVHDERIGQLERVSEKRVDDIKEIHSRISTQTREIVEKISALETSLENRMAEGAKNSAAQHREIQKEIKADVAKLDTRLGVLENWRWYILGGVAVIGYILGNLTDIAKFLAK